IALSIPASLFRLQRTSGNPDANVIGVQSLTQRREETIITRAGIVGVGKFRTLDRSGNPGLNALVIPFGRKDEYNFATPLDDSRGQFAGERGTEVRVVFHARGHRAGEFVAQLRFQVGVQADGGAILIHLVGGPKARKSLRAGRDSAGDRTRTRQCLARQQDVGGRLARVNRELLLARLQARGEVDRLHAEPVEALHEAGVEHELLVFQPARVELRG
ncbi:MAG: DUF4331 domain-containing protein, partial [Gammaproteobacteria bacterium]|nr:DUF4331 domain-containing protein [Gammaproteobacteria bacterium]